MNANGRPSAIHDTLMIVELLNGIKHGLTYDMACRRAGLGRSTFHSWRMRGKTELDRIVDGGKPRKKEKPYADFVKQLDAIKPQAEMALSQVVHKAAFGGEKIRETTIIETIDPKGNTKMQLKKTVEKEIGPDWRAADRILEKRYGWVLKNQNFNINLDDFTDEELERVAAGENPLDVITARLSDDSQG